MPWCKVLIHLLRLIPPCPCPAAKLIVAPTVYLFAVSPFTSKSWSFTQHPLSSHHCSTFVFYFLYPVLNKILKVAKIKGACVFYYINLFLIFIYFWLHWVFVAVHGLSLVVASRGYSSLQCAGFSLRWLLVAEHGL